MRIRNVTLTNFRCFGPSPTTVELQNPVTALIGANGSGKTALLMALARLFGTARRERAITRSDFHTPPGANTDEAWTRDLVIEVTIDFPELDDRAQSNDSIPPTFDQMIVAAPGEAPICRMRLEATWLDNGTVEGSIEQRVFWVLSTMEDPPDESKHRVALQDRDLIQMIYVPAIRDPIGALRYSAQTNLGRLMRAIAWKDDTRAIVRDASQAIDDAVSHESGITAIAEALQGHWELLHREPSQQRASLRFEGVALEDVLGKLVVTFLPGADQGQSDLASLSEGQRSLFHLALVGAVAEVEGRLAQHANQPQQLAPPTGNAIEDDLPDLAPNRPQGFQAEQLTLPALTVIAIEEPENHLSPHYLSRIISMLRSMSTTTSIQAMLSSHSPALMRRAEPNEIRHFRRDSQTKTSIVRPLSLPEHSHDAGKYVRGAVRAYPELYFAKFVILAEGPSEEIVIPKIAEAHGQNIDQLFICVVPLGGRHVNHFWRLLTDLNIPYATLLDLDARRPTGGWERIKYILMQLLDIGVPPDRLLKQANGNAALAVSHDDLTTLHERPLTDMSELEAWCRHLEQFDVYFSRPLDFDWAMYRSFPKLYRSAADGRGPRIPSQHSPDRDHYFRAVLTAVLGTPDIPTSYDHHDLHDAFAWYRYLFMARSKPATHLQAMSEVEPARLHKDAPEPILRILERAVQVADAQ